MELLRRQGWTNVRCRRCHADVGWQAGKMQKLPLMHTLIQSPPAISRPIVQGNAVDGRGGLHAHLPARRRRQGRDCHVRMSRERCLGNSWLAGNCRIVSSVLLAWLPAPSSLRLACLTRCCPWPRSSTATFGPSLSPRRAWAQAAALPPLPKSATSGFCPVRAGLVATVGGTVGDAVVWRSLRC